MSPGEPLFTSIRLEWLERMLVAFRVLAGYRNPTVHFYHELSEQLAWSGAG